MSLALLNFYCITQPFSFPRLLLASQHLLLASDINDGDGQALENAVLEGHTAVISL